MKPVHTLNADLVKESSKPSFKEVVFFDVKDWEKEEIKKLDSQFNVRLCEDSLSAKNAADFSMAEVISVFVNSTLDAGVLSQFKQLKLITTRSTGFDHIDLEYCKSKSIDVANVPSYGSNTVAEHAMALMLALFRRIPESVERVRKSDFSPVGLTGLDVRGKTIGVVGTGKIGQNMIKYAKGFSMNVLAFDIHPNLDLAKELDFDYVEIKQILSDSDVISFHAPYNKDTHHLINFANIYDTKSGVFLINTARGGLIETKCLYEALRSGHVGGAGLDVLEGEKYLMEEAELLHSDRDGADLKIAVQNYLMSHMPNVIITPHNAFNSKEALDRIIQTTIENILCYANGSCDNVVNN